MTDITNVGLAAFAVLGTSVAGMQFGMPDWAVLALSASVGSLMSAGWRIIGGQIVSWLFGLMAFATGAVSGVVMASMIVAISSLEPNTATHFAFFFSFIGAKFTRALSVGTTGDTMADGLGNWMRSKLGAKK